MCGIVGILTFNGYPVEKEVLNRMSQILTHRGPDAEGVYVSSDGNPHSDISIGLGHRRLSIIDLSPAGKQPMSNEDGSIWLVCNGEIYNFQKLRADLICKGHLFSSNSDSEVIIHLYEEYGDNCVKKLNGIFAFALWDEKTQKLLLAVDRVGVKPLYYLHDDEKLIFASEIKAILEYPNINREVNLEALHHYLTYLYVPAPNTMFKGIKRLEPSHILTWTRQGVKSDRYWKLDITEELGRPEKYYAENLLNQLKSTIQMEMVADVPVGIFLSGGIDSSAIVAVAAQLSSEPVKTFSIGFEEEEYNELKYARFVAERYKTEHHEFIVKPNELDLLTKIIWQFDEPFADSSALANYRLAEMASQYVKVALSGAGGDEVFAGYYHYQADKIAAILDKYPDFIKTFIPKVIDILPISQQKPNIFRRTKRVLENAVYQPEYRHCRYINIYNFNEEQKFDLYSHELKQHLKDSDSLDFTKSFFDEAESAHFLQRAFYVDLFTYLSNDVLILTDKMSMLHSLEVRVPYLNYKFLEYAFTIPSFLKLKGFEKKYILKKALKELLPKTILKRKKRGFAVPILHWFNRDLKEVFTELFSEKNVKKRGYFNYDYIAMLLKQHNDGVNDNSFKLWQLLCFELWHRIYIDGSNVVC